MLIVAVLTDNDNDVQISMRMRMKVDNEVKYAVDNGHGKFMLMKDFCIMVIMKELLLLWPCFPNTPS